MRRADLPQLQGSAPAATEVLGVPLPQRGYHLIEVESRILGSALLSPRAPMYARTGALVTNLSVHFKRGRSSSLVWVSSEWMRGIEPWRFNLPYSQDGGDGPDAVAHTVFDRTLLRVGETVSMKHFLRLATEKGLALPPREQLPTELVLTHMGSGNEVKLPLAWPRGARST